MEKLSTYFENKKGRGILATADRQGKVDAAVYAKPHFADENNIAFIMADRLTHSNIRQNPKAVYLFMEDGEHYEGKRLFLTMTRESEDQALIESMRRKKCCCSGKGSASQKSFLVYFKIDSVLPLVGVDG